MCLWASPALRAEGCISSVRKRAKWLAKAASSKAKRARDGQMAKRAISKRRVLMLSVEQQQDG